MSRITRNPDIVCDDRFDIVVVGGGIYGVCVLLEASRRGLRTLLIERHDFGGATSWNSLRIIHGGLRYLQSLDLFRFRRSVREQAWWLENFPDLVQPLPCLMPLYNQGLRRTNVLAMALKLNDILAKPIRAKVLRSRSWPDSRVLSRNDTLAKFPNTHEGLKAGAMWYDAHMTSPQRLIVELLRWSASLGGCALNYMEFTGCQTSGNLIQAVMAKCGVTGREYSFRTKYVINCSGPWANELPDLESPTIPRLKDSAIAFNVVVNRQPICATALAVSEPSSDAPTYFVVPLGHRMMIGTQHLPPQSEPTPSDEQIRAFLDGLNRAIPGFGLAPTDVDDVLTGLLPPKPNGSKNPIKSPIIRRPRSGGIKNALCVVGPKYTTARHVAQLALREVAKHLSFDMHKLSASRPQTSIHYSRMKDVAAALEDGLAQDLQQWMGEESVVYVDDFLLRRNDFDNNTRQTLNRLLAEKLHWKPSALESNI